MRIRRRPPGQPLAYLLPSDPYPVPQSSPPPPPPPGSNKQGDGDGELHLHPDPATDDSAADLGDARSSSPLSRPALPPQDGAVERSTTGLGARAQQQQQQQQEPADGRTSLLENGLHRHLPEPVTTIQAGERLSNNGVVSAAAVAKATKKQQQEKNDTSGGGTKRAPRGPAVLLEGSRCSRKNGRGWRCSQPTMVGYALCQYHLGKGRMKSGRTATGGRGPGQLGRTEHAKKSSAAVSVARAAATVVAAPKADDVPPPPPQQQPSVQHC